MALTHGREITLRCMGLPSGPHFLDGHTHDGTVALAPKAGEQFSGTKWRVFGAGQDMVRLRCEGKLEGSRWLDGRTHNGTVGLAPKPEKPFTGTLWKVLQADENNSDIIVLQCMGKLEGPRFLDGRTPNGSVGLSQQLGGAASGTRWEARSVPILFDDD